MHFIKSFWQMTPEIFVSLHLGASKHEGATGHKAASKRKSEMFSAPTTFKGKKLKQIL